MDDVEEPWNHLNPVETRDGGLNQPLAPLVERQDHEADQQVRGFPLRSAEIAIHAWMLAVCSRSIWDLMVVASRVVERSAVGFQLLA